MAQASAIADVGTAIVDLLVDRIGRLEETDVGLASPDEGDEFRVTVYLYRVTESAHFRRVDRPLVEGADGKRSPLVVDLNYLVTAHPRRGRNGGQRADTQHELLGRVIQVLGDNAVLRGPLLTDDLRAGPDVRVSLDAESLGEITNIWSTFDDVPFRPSVAYLVTPIVIDSGPEPESPYIVEATHEVYDRGPEVDDGA